MHIYTTYGKHAIHQQISQSRTYVGYEHSIAYCATVVKKNVVFVIGCNTTITLFCRNFTENTCVIMMMLRFHVPAKTDPSVPVQLSEPSPIHMRTSPSYAACPANILDATFWYRGRVVIFAKHSSWFWGQCHGECNNCFKRKRKPCGYVEGHFCT